jgi:hypothetical protein
VLSLPTAKAIDVLHHRVFFHSHRACHHKTSRSSTSLARDRRRRTPRGLLILAIFSSYHSRSLAPAATAKCQWPSQVWPKSATSSCGLFMDTNQANHRPLFWSTAQSSNNCVKSRRAGPHPPRPTISYAFRYNLFVELSTLAQTLAGKQPDASGYSSEAREHPSLSLRGRQLSCFELKPLLFKEDRSTTFAPGARNREVEVWTRVLVVLVVVALPVDPLPWTPDPRSRNSHTANPASALQENGAQIYAYDQKGGLSFPMQSCIRILQGSAASTCESVHPRESAKDPRPMDSISNKQKNAHISCTTYATIYPSSVKLWTLNNLKSNTRHSSPPKYLPIQG